MSEAVLGPPAPREAPRGRHAGPRRAALPAPGVPRAPRLAGIPATGCVETLLEVWPTSRFFFLICKIGVDFSFWGRRAVKLAGDIEDSVRKS